MNMKKTPNFSPIPNSLNRETVRMRESQSEAQRSLRSHTPPLGIKIPKNLTFTSPPENQYSTQPALKLLLVTRYKKIQIQN